MKKVSVSLRLVLSVLLLSVFSLGVFTPNQATAATTRTPVIFVHGLGGTASNFTYIESYLSRQGWASNERYAIELPSKSGNQLLNAATISRKVDEVLAQTGSQKVNIVAHSMGGANSLYYILNNGGLSKVDKLVTIGGANRLTTSRAPEGIKVTSIYTINDQIVSNQLSMLDGANNIRVFGMAHIGLLYSPSVSALITTALEE
ncbi:Triacylglycerol lipase [Paenibacillus nuruki]|uniref:Triacylglycerol lipase n=1 Tax=Paenibacillus nuruki TaxID=1886670 RepID=A0A1E3L3Q2_9BACL|nr:alpha/beta fold hydrolase [Paenibacillus nuruki]ODP28376.1 Triacylglycerol lipase [Paenibacillus nuruki]